MDTLMECEMENVSENNENNPMTPGNGSILSKRKRKNVEHTATPKRVSFALSSPEVLMFDRSRTKSPPPKSAILLQRRASLTSPTTSFGLTPSHHVHSVNPSTPAIPSTFRRTSLFCETSSPQQRSSFNSSLILNHHDTTKRGRFSSAGGFGSSLQPPAVPQKYNQWGNQPNRYHSLLPGQVDGHMVNSSFTYYPVTPVRCQRSSSFRSLNTGFYNRS